MTLNEINNVMGLVIGCAQDVKNTECQNNGQKYVVDVLRDKIAEALGQKLDQDTPDSVQSYVSAYLGH